jgi:hypothetical protein
MAADEVLSLLVGFINKNANVVDIQWDQRMSPRLPFNPYSEKYGEWKKKHKLLPKSCRK